jgi:hypothetical protein
MSHGAATGAQYRAIARSQTSESRMETLLITALTRILRVNLAPRQRSARNPTLKDLARIRRQLARCIEDCTTESAHRLRKQIDSARTPQELWLLRNDAYQQISQRHNQSVAADRINRLIQYFDGWLEPRQLVRIK